MPYDRPLFRDLQECLHWAWYDSAIAANTVKGPTWAQFQKDDEREQIDGERPKPYSLDIGGKPRGFLAAGQAGDIQRRVMAMPGDEGAHIMVKFLRGRERFEARRILRRLVADYINAHGKDRRAVGLLLSMFYYGRKDKGKSLTPTAIARKLSLDRRRVQHINRRLQITLDALATRAEHRLYWELQSRGIVR